MITAEQARQLLRMPIRGEVGADGLRIIPAMFDAGPELCQTVIAQAEQIERVRALAALWDRTDEPAGESLLAALDGGR